MVNNITMNHVHHYPIYITTGCRNRGPKEHITNIKADVLKGSKQVIKK